MTKKFKDLQRNDKIYVICYNITEGSNIIKEVMELTVTSIEPINLGFIIKARDIEGNDHHRFTVEHESAYDDSVECYEGVLVYDKEHAKEHVETELKKITKTYNKILKGLE